MCAYICNILVILVTIIQGRFSGGGLHSGLLDAIDLEDPACQPPRKVEAEVFSLPLSKLHFYRVLLSDP